MAKRGANRPERIPPKRSSSSTHYPHTGWYPFRHRVGFSGQIPRSSGKLFLPQLKSVTTGRANRLKEEKRGSELEKQSVQVRGRFSSVVQAGISLSLWTYTLATPFGGTSRVLPTPPTNQCLFPFVWVREIEKGMQFLHSNTHSHIRFQNRDKKKTKTWRGNSSSTTAKIVIQFVILILLFSHWTFSQRLFELKKSKKFQTWPELAKLNGME